VSGAVKASAGTLAKYAIWKLKAGSGRNSLRPRIVCSPPVRSGIRQLRCEGEAQLLSCIMSLLLAHREHPERATACLLLGVKRVCPLLGVKQTSYGRAPISAFDPKRT